MIEQDPGKRPSAEDLLEDAEARDRRMRKIIEATDKPLISGMVLDSHGNPTLKSEGQFVTDPNFIPLNTGPTKPSLN